MDTVQSDLIETLKGVLNEKAHTETSSDLQNMFFVSHYLKNHPILGESIYYKNQYLGILEYFVNNYAQNNLFASAALLNYKQAFFGHDSSRYMRTHKKIKDETNRIARSRFKPFTVYSNRFILVVDIIFLCAFNDAHKGHVIFRQIKGIYHRRYHPALDDLYHVLFEHAAPSPRLRAVYPQLKAWAENMDYLEKRLSTILFVANMSAGKSTLINAIVGKKINRSLSQACTSKLHYIYSKSFEDDYTYEFDHALNLNADNDTLMDDNINNTTNEIMVGTFFRLAVPCERRLCFLDTPGANFSRDPAHGDLSKDAIQRANYDTLVYVLAAGSTGINDEYEYLNYVKHHHKNCRLFFVFNKLDEYNKSEDSIYTSMKQIDTDLTRIGFTDYRICPVSGYAGYLAKCTMAGMSFSPGTAEFFELMHCKAKFNDPDFDFSKFYDVPTGIIDLARESFPNNSEEFELLLKSGMLGLEYMLTQ